jgi:hypothetical protein
MSVIDWNTPPGAGPDWLMGAGATRAERALIWTSSLLGVAYIVSLWVRGQPGEWAGWQYALAALLAADLVGGAVSNATSSTKRQYFGPADTTVTGVGRVLRTPVLFTALHVYPFLIVALYPGGSWTWATVAYGGVVGGALVVDRLVPQYLQRPIAMLAFCAVFLVSLRLQAPAGWEWFTVVYAAKLVLAHSVREEPYRPRRGT